MKRIVGWVVTVCLVVGLAGPVLAQPSGGAVPEGFEKVSDAARPAEHLPAAPMVMAAYAFIWAALLAYLFVLWRRLGAVDRDLAALRRGLEERR